MHISIGEKSMTATIERQTEHDFSFRKPVKDDGAAVWALVKSTGVLDLNSPYSYLMWCEFFSDTSIVIEHDDNVVGFVSGFIQPTAADTLFVWQIAVDAEERGKGLGTSMLLKLLASPACEHIQFVEATVSPSNIPSQQLFKGLAKKLQTQCRVSQCFSKDHFPGNGHEEEWIHRVGPFL